MKRLVLGTIVAGTAVFSMLGIFFAACGSTPPVGGGTGAKGGGGITEFKLDGSATGPGQGGNDGSGTAGPPPTGDANCGAQPFGTSRQPADVLLVLDRSGSMDYSTTADSSCNGAAGCTARWTAVTSAVNATLTSTANSISWGLKLFSSTGSACGMNSNNTPEVPVAATSVPAINTRIAATKPGGNTPTAQAITAATAYLKTVTDQNAKYILLATDGEPNCAQGGNGTPNVPATVAAIEAAKAAGFLVYVIGIGPSAGNLDSFAVAGGTTNYFPATSPQALTDAFATISKAVTTCTFAVQASAGQDPNNIAVYLDGNLLKKDDPNGWSFGGSTQSVVVGGASCDAITAGTATKVQVLFGCPGESPPTTLY